MKLSPEEKERELMKYLKLNVAMVEYIMSQIGEAPGSREQRALYSNLIEEYHIDFEKKRLTKLKVWFRSWAEGIVESREIKIIEFLKEQTGYDVDIFKAFDARIEKIIAKGKITTDNQFYDIQIVVNELCQAEPVDIQKLSVLNKLLTDYEMKAK